MSGDEFRFLPVDTVGSADAESDPYLAECFVDIGGYIAAMKDTSDARSIIVGRTGSGKSALLEHLYSTASGTVLRVKPEDLALEHVSNSQILGFLSSIGVRLDPFFRLLWRHVIAVEILRSKVGAKSGNAFDKVLKRLFERDALARHREAVEYLKQWGTSFWLESEYRVKEVTENLEKRFTSEIGVSLGELISSRGAVDSLVGATAHAEVLQRAQEVVKKVQLRELNKVIDLIDAILDDRQKPVYVVIDQLDDNWVHEEVRYRLVRALIEAVKDFGRVRNGKVLLAMREDLLQTVFSRTRDPGFQQEKYESLCLRPVWDPTTLREVLDRRVDALVRRRYTKSSVGLDDIFPGPRGGRKKKENAVSFVLGRTLLRPRDAIEFVNIAIQQSSGSSGISWPQLVDAERLYSRNRMRALHDEWRTDYPMLRIWISVLSGMPSRFIVRQLGDEALVNAALSVCTAQECPEDGWRPLVEVAKAVCEGEKSAEQLRVELLAVFFRVGVVGFKFEPHLPARFCTTGRVDVVPHEIRANHVVIVHPMVRSALGITVSHGGQ